MGTKILSVAAIFLCSVAWGFAQIQLDPQQLNEKESPNDAKLVAAKPLPPEQQQQFQHAIKDIHFDFDRADLRPEDRAILASDAEWLKSHPEVLITLEGDADERGDVVYNVVLSGERAMAARDALVELGVPADRIAFATGWGKLYPVCSQSDESCWSQNRRTHFATWPPAEGERAQVASR
jgi:outer membrane protein OmpA-like peptidoglycan-associated protein